MAAGTMVALSAATDDIDTTDQLVMFEAYQKAFVVNGENLKVADFINTKLVNATSITISDVSRGAVLSQAGASAATMTVDLVHSVNIYGYTTGGTFEVTTAVTNSAGTTVCTPSVVSEASSTPHWYDYTVWPDGASGSLPAKAYLGCLYRGRIVLSGNPQSPYQWYMSRQAHPWDFAYLAADAQSPVSGGNADAGELGDIITCLIPYKDDFLIFGCVHSIWVLRGDPAAGGSLDEVNLATGIFGPYAYCWDNANNLYFFGSGGIYRMGPGFAPPENITATNLPNLIEDLGVAQGTHRITLAFDRIRLGILISIVTLADGSATNFWYDLRTEGFYPEVYGSNCGPYSLFYYESQTEAYRGLLVGGMDGYIRTFDDDAKSDDNGDSDTAIDSYAVMGPIPLGRDANSRGRLQTLAITTGTDTDSVDWSLFSKDTAEEIVDAVVAGSTPFNTGTISSGNRVQKLRPRCRAAWMGLKLQNDTAGETWQFEKGVANITPAGEI